MNNDDQRPPVAQGSALEVFGAFLKLGLTAFGGPIAHLGYFRYEFVTRRRWLGDAEYADLVALCQFLPGPASSQAGFALGLLRAGPTGAIAAWLGFTLPSAIVLVLFAYSSSLAAGRTGAGTLHGLQLVAVAVVAQAVWGMGRTLTPDPQRMAIAVAALSIVLLAPAALGQVGAIALGGVAGLVLCRGGRGGGVSLAFPVTRSVGALCLGFFGLLLVVPPLLLAMGAPHAIAMFEAFYRAGALVFGGGHVVLPLLDAAVVQSGWVNAEAFLAGYGVAQAMPGPLFTFAAYLGAASSQPPSGVLGAGLALIALFLPGFLILLGAMPFWDDLRRLPSAQAALRGANAAVVGILAAALYDPVWTSAVRSPLDLALAACGFAALVVYKAPPLLVVAALAGVGAVLL